MQFIDLMARRMSLPMHPYLTVEEIDRICESLPNAVAPIPA